MKKTIERVTKKMDNCISILERINQKLNTEIKIQKMNEQRAKEDMQDEILDTYENLIEDYEGGEIAFYDNDPTLHVFYNGTDHEEEIIITAVKLNNFRYLFEADAGSDTSNVSMTYDKDKAMFTKTYFDEDGMEEDWLDFTLYDLDLKEALEYLMLYSSVVLEEYVDNFYEDKISVDYQLRKIRPLTSVRC